MGCETNDADTVRHSRASAIPWRPSFGLRLAITLLITIVVVGAAQYFLAARQLSARAYEQTAAGYAADSRVLEKLAAASPADPLAPVRGLLGHIAARPGIDSVDLVGPDGAVVVSRSASRRAAGSAAASESMPGMPSMPAMESIPPAKLDAARRAVVARVLADGVPYGGDDPAPGSDGGLYAIPLELDGARHVLVVAKPPGVLEQQLSDLRWVILLTLFLGLPLGLPVFYLLGGRSLSARYATAIRRSSRDGLTRLGNHRSFHEELRREVEVAVRHRRPLTLALLDLDSFKGANDRHGHRHGDGVLAHVGRIMLAGRPEDRGFRIGGDEFALLLPGASVENGRIPLERIRARIEQEIDGQTVSVGIAQLDPSADAETLLAAADAVLYEAKSRGRNGIVLAPAPVAAAAA